MRRSLARKLGPLPVWGWLAIGGAVLLYVRQRNQTAQDTQAAQDGAGTMYGGGGYQGDPYAAPGAGPTAPAAAAQSGTDAGRSLSATGNIVNVNLASQPTQGVTQPALTAPRASTTTAKTPVAPVGSGVNPYADFFASPEYQTALQLSRPSVFVGSAPAPPGGAPSLQSAAPRYLSAPTR